MNCFVVHITLLGFTVSLKMQFRIQFAFAVDPALPIRDLNFKLFSKMSSPIIAHLLHCTQNQEQVQGLYEQLGKKGFLCISVEGKTGSGKTADSNELQNVVPLSSFFCLIIHIVMKVTKHLTTSRTS